MRQHALLANHNFRSEIAMERNKQKKHPSKNYNKELAQGGKKYC
jgi:hypothetical protein